MTKSRSFSGLISIYWQQMKNAPLNSQEDRPIYAIGDIHGCSSELSSLLSKIDINKNTLVVFLGDYVDRGPNSRGVIDQILELQKKCEVVTLMGNHEAMFLDFLERPESVGAGLFVLNGGTATLSNYYDDNGAFLIPREHLAFLHQLKVFHQTEHHFFVHAGVPAKKKLNDLDPTVDREVCLWTRNPFLNSTEDWGKLVVHGHTPVLNPEIRPNRVNVDSGCVYGGLLSAYDCTNKRIISVPRLSQNKEVLYPRDPFGRIAVRFNGRMPVIAGLKGGSQRSLETLNYNQFGLLIKEMPETLENFFAMNDIIEGVIGDKPEKWISFTGQIVRVEVRDHIVAYGVKCLSMSEDF